MYTANGTQASRQWREFISFLIHHGSRDDQAKLQDEVRLEYAIEHCVFWYSYADPASATNQIDSKLDSKVASAVRARASFQLQDFDGALEHLNVVIYSSASSCCKELKLFGFLLRGYILHLLVNFEGARSEYEIGAELIKQIGGEITPNVLCNISSACILSNQNQLMKALEYIDQAISKRPNNALFHAYRGFARFLVDQHELAIVDLDLAEHIARSGEYPYHKAHEDWFTIVRSQVYVKLNEIEKAIHLLCSAHFLHSFFGSFALHLSEILENRTKASMIDFESLISKLEDWPEDSDTFVLELLYALRAIHHAHYVEAYGTNEFKDFGEIINRLPIFNN